MTIKLWCILRESLIRSLMFNTFTAYAMCAKELPGLTKRAAFEKSYSHRSFTFAYCLFIPVTVQFSLTSSSSSVNGAYTLMHSMFESNRGAERILKI